VTPQDLLDRLVRLAEADERIAAVLLYGSYASGTADEHSDVDIGLVVTDAAQAEFVAERGVLIQALSEPLLAEDFGEPSRVHVIFADGVACELIIDREKQLDLARPYRTLLDKTGVVERALARAPAAPERPDAETVRRLVMWFWHDLEHVTVALSRGQLLWAHGGLEELRGVCLQLARLAAGADLEAADPYWKVDAVLPPATVATLRSTIVPAEEEPMREAARALVAVYRQLAPDLAAAHGLAYPEALDRLISARLA
jgi:predicted nucleotidyltransferase